MIINANHIEKKERSYVLVHKRYSYIISMLFDLDVGRPVRLCYHPLHSENQTAIQLFVRIALPFFSGQYWYCTSCKEEEESSCFSAFKINALGLN